MKNVTAIGEILFDIYPEGKKPGGAPFNFIYHIIKLTGNGKFVSRVGRDDPGDELIDHLTRKEISTEFIQSDNVHKTGAARTRLNENKIPRFSIDEESAYDFIELSGELENLVSEKTDYLYFGTLAQRNRVSRNTIQTLAGKNVRCFCDLNIRQNFYTRELVEDCLRSADALKLNEDELELVESMLPAGNAGTRETALRIREQYNIDLLCVTMGSEGAVLYRGDEKNEYNISPSGVVDTVGAGDAYASMMCIGYMNNWSLRKTNMFASEFAGEIVKVEGALPHDDKIYETFRLKIRNDEG